MKKTSLLLLVLVYFLPGYADKVNSISNSSVYRNITFPNFDDSSGRTRRFEHQLGLNATNFIQTLASLSGNTFASSPYSVNYKMLMKTPEGSFLNAAGLRVGYGRRRTRNETQATSSSTKFSTDTREIFYRLGGEIQKQLSKYWTVYVGIDYTFQDLFDETKTTFNFGFGETTTTTTEKGRNEGWGPVFGVQFNISKHLCLATELTFYQVTGSTTTSTTSTDPNSFSQYNIQKRKTGTMILPSFINFNFRF